MLPTIKAIADTADTRVFAEWIKELIIIKLPHSLHEDGCMNGALKTLT